MPGGVLLFISLVISILFSVTPVSYTHLDVYKRQSKTSFNYMFHKKIITTGVFTEMLNPKNKRA